jgi:hypothetical protein
VVCSVAQQQRRKYEVALTDEKPECTCRDYEFRNDKCKHILAVEYTIERERTANGQTVVTETVKSLARPTRRTGPPYNAAPTQAAPFLSLSRDADAPACRLLTSIFASTFKVYSTVSGRRFTSDLQEAKRRLFPTAEFEIKGQLAAFAVVLRGVIEALIANGQITPQQVLTILHHADLKTGFAIWDSLQGKMPDAELRRMEAQAERFLSTLRNGNNILEYLTSHVNGEL